MLLEKLESGFLLFKTQQGMVRVELSTRQRIYLLWTFRHFRQLSIPLLNARQRTLVNDLFRNRAVVVVDSYNPSLVIGVVENFVPPASMDASPVWTQSPESAQTQDLVHKKKQVQKKEDRQEKVVPQPCAVTPQPASVPSPSLAFVWPTLNWPKFATSKLATTLGALCLCVLSVGAWHRMQAVPAAQTHNQNWQVNAIAAPDSPRSAQPEVVAESAIAVAPTAAAPLTAAVETTAAPASIAKEVPVHIAAPSSTAIATPKPMIPDRHAVSTPRLQSSGQDSSIGIQASRPPLRFAYPDYADIRARGVVSLIAGVDSDGVVRTVRVVSGNRSLAAAAILAVRHWRYRPYLKDGQPVATETNIVISYFSNDAISMSFPPTIPASR